MVERGLNRLPHEIWLMISRHLSLGDLAAFHLALPDATYAGILKTLAFPASEELHLMMLLSPLAVTLEIAGEPFATNEPTPGKPSSKPKANEQRMASPSLEAYQPFVGSSAFGSRQVSTTSSAKLACISDLVISYRQVGGRTISCPRPPFITPLHGKQPLEPTNLQLSLSSMADQFPASDRLVLDYAKGLESLLVTSDGEYRLDGEVAFVKFYRRSIFQNLKIQSAVWKTRTWDIELPKEWLKDIVTVFVLVCFSKKEPLTGPEDAVRPIRGAGWHVPGEVEFGYRDISIPLTPRVKEAVDAIEESSDDDVGP